jgi:hypothetical protein
MKKSDIVTMPVYFDKYINLADDIEVTEALIKYGEKFVMAERPTFEQLGDMVYAPGKWTVKDILQHLIDAERVFSYRAMRYARKDKTSLPGFDENTFAVTAGPNNRELDDLLSEFVSVRNATIKLFKSFTPEMLIQEGISFDKNISVLALGFTMTGHVIHHMGVLKERYYKLV